MDIQSLSIVAFSLIQADDELVISTSNPDSLLPLLCSLEDTFYVSSEKFRKGVVEENLVLSSQVYSLGVEVELLGDNIGSDPGLTDISLRSAWEGIAW